MDNLNKELERLLKMLPAMESGDLTEWTADRVTAVNIPSMRAPTVEYWDIIHRFAEAVLELKEQTENGAGPTDPVAREAVGELAAMIEQEDELPGIMLGYIYNGTVINLLKQLAAEQDRLR